MAHFAEIDSDNKVIRVIVVSNDLEANGAQWCHDTFGGTWVQTSYNATIRKNYAGQGYTWDSIRNAFIPPQPYPSWLLNEDTCRWEPPVAMPVDGQPYIWDEPSMSWAAILISENP
jgi:hypothetical protein